MRKAACPSFRCHTPGCAPTARSARTPPIPRIISWRTRVDSSPPYRRWVISRSEGAFSAQLVSRRYTGTRPTRAFHTRHHIARGHPHAHLHPLAGGCPYRLDRQVARIVLEVLGVLHPIAVDRLCEVPLLVQETDGGEVGALVASCLAVVHGEDPAAPGIDGEALVEPVLGAEVGDQRAISGRKAQVGIERLQGDVIAREISLIPRAALEHPLADAAEHQAGIAVRLLPELRIQVLEQRSYRPVPAEEKIGGQLGQTRQTPRYHGCDLEQRVSHPRLSRRGTAGV